MKVLNVIIANWDFILLIIAAASIVLYAIFKGNKSVVMRMLYSLVTNAEWVYGSGTGSLKLAAVIDTIYPNLPTIIKAFISDKTLVKWVEEALAAAKEAWEKNPALLTSYSESPKNDAKDAETGKDK